MKRTMILCFGTAALATLATTPAAAQRWRHNGRNVWRTIAYTQVNGRDRDTIRVPGTARYRQLRVCVFDGSIDMRDVDVWFRNGGHQDIGTRSLMRSGTCTRNLDLRGRRRDVTAIRLSYVPLRRGWRPPVVRVQVR
jgi:hypothetical protein